MRILEKISQVSEEKLGGYRQELERLRRSCTLRSAVALHKVAYELDSRKGALSKHAGEKTAILETGIGPLLWGLGGGLGGMLLGSRVINPLVQMKEESIKRQLAKGESVLDKLRRIRKVSPIATGALGALILATIAAKKARAKERERIEQYGPVPAYQHGFTPSDLYSVNDPSARFYD